MVILTKGNGGFRGIGIVEVLRKALYGGVNWRIGAAVQFHDVIHGFRAVRGDRGHLTLSQAALAANCDEGGGPLRGLP